MFKNSVSGQHKILLYIIYQKSQSTFEYGNRVKIKDYMI